MNIIAAQEIKRRGMAAVDSLITNGPVQVLKSNRPRYVVMSKRITKYSCPISPKHV